MLLRVDLQGASVEVDVMQTAGDLHPVVARHDAAKPSTGRKLIEQCHGADTARGVPRTNGGAVYVIHRRAVDAFEARRALESSREDAVTNDGSGEIRTLETVSRPHAFQACALNHSATDPVSGKLRGVRGGARGLPPPAPVPVPRSDHGQGEIRTHDTVAGMPVFETGAFNHSATCPANAPPTGGGGVVW